MTYSIYLKSGQVITGVLSSDFNKIRESFIKSFPNQLTSTFSWFNGKDKFMFDLIQIAGIYPEKKESGV